MDMDNPCYGCCKNAIYEEEYKLMKKNQDQLPENSRCIK